MSFELQPVQGDSFELATDLKELPQHEREERVIPVIKDAIASIVEELGGYLSVSCKGNLNPVAGETGESVEIYITSLPRPQSVSTPITVGEVEQGPSESPVQQEMPPSKLAEQPPVITENVSEDPTVLPVESSISIFSDPNIIK